MTGRMLAINVSGQESLQRTREWFSRDDPTILVTVATLLGLIILAMGVGGVWQRLQDWRMEPTQRHPMGLFRRLQRELRVPWADRWRLWRLSRRLKLPHPSALLISDLFFDDCVQKLQAMSGREQTTHDYQALRRHLFGTGRN